MKIVCISDIHSLYYRMKHSMPSGDVLVVAGDMTNIGTADEVIDFNTWLGKLSYDVKICVAGNHDFLFEKNPILSKQLMTNCIYLEDEGIVIDGIKFHGSPWQNEFYNWAFNLPVEGKEIEHKFSLIPDDVDVLITHTPIYGILDVSRQINLGSQMLLEKNKAIKEFKIICFGTYSSWLWNCSKEKYNFRKCINL